MLYPDNFLYFLTLFSLASFMGTYLLLSYNRSHLIILNALLFYIVAIRACTEYYMPQLTNYETAEALAAFHSILMQVWGIFLWYILWFYINPFRGFKWEKQVNQFYLWGLIVLPSLIIFYFLLNRTFYTIHSEPIANYWRYTANTELLSTRFYFFYSYVFMPFIVRAILLIDIIRNKQQRLQKLAVWLFLIFILPVIAQKALFQATDKFQIPNFAFLYLSTSIILSWFISEYRLFRDGFDEAKKDLLNSISDLAISTNLNLTITHANENVRQLLKVNHQSIIHLLTGFSKSTAIQINNSIQKLIQHPGNELELILDIPEVGIKTFTCKAAPFKKGRQKIGYTFLLKDLTLIREKEHQLAEANAAKDRLFAIISHDLRKPALAFRGISKKVKFLIQQKEFETLDRYGIALEKAAFALNNLLDNLLNWALQQRKVAPYRPIPIDVAQVTQEIYDLFSQVAKDKAIALQMNIPESTVIFADLHAYSTIVRNLLDNAIKYTSVGGSIDLSAEQLDKTVLVKVKDTGIGIEPDKIDSIFELTANKSEQGTKGEMGSGLGLTLVRDLVKLNKGVITVESHWNRGSVFEVELPREG